MPNEVRNASNKEHIERVETKQKIAEKQRIEDLVRLLAMPEFRRFIWRLLSRCKVNQSVFEQSARIYYNSGQQDIGHYVLGEVVEARPDAYIQMMEEHKNA